MRRRQKTALLSYLKEFGAKSFREYPFSEVDALVLSQLSYIKLDGVVPGFGRQKPVSWAAIKQHPNAEHLFSDPVFGSMYREIFNLISGSVRYGKIQANYFSEWLDEEREAQFAAVTFFLGSTSLFVSFRGTDETLVGWKEDFNMSYMRAVPSQRLALAYLKGVARYAPGRLVLGGHSKGGNLAIFAASNAPTSIQQRIRRIYSFDGPGFQKNFYEKQGFCRVEDRFCKIVPEQSVVGMLLANYKQYRVVCSYRAGVIQHDLMNWKIREGKFVYRKELYRKSRKAVSILNAWINSLSREQVALFVDTLYELLQATHARTIYELENGPKLLRLLHSSFRKLDGQRQKLFLQIVRGLFKTARSMRRMDLQ